MKFYLLLFPFLTLNVFADEEPEKTVFVRPKSPPNAYFIQYFTSPSNLETDFVISQAKKEGVADSIAKYDATWQVEVPTSSAIENDLALVLKSRAKHAALATKLRRPVRFETKQLVVQYEVRFQNSHECGGAYIKLLSQEKQLNLEQLTDKTNYTIMFGPDRCGNDNKLHFIIRHKNPITGHYEEKVATKPLKDSDKYFTDRRTHLYTLVLNEDNTFEMYVDQNLVNSGSLLKDLTPAINPPEEIDDPNDTKPADWDDRDKIADPAAAKPDDWDEDQPRYVEDTKAVKPEGWLDAEPLTIPDPKATPPADWDKEMDGQWEAPQIDNPACKSAPGCGPWTRPTVKNPLYKGKWTAPQIDNPAYRGAWKPARIPNPAFFQDDAPFRGLAPISALALELWSMNDEIAFDNFLIVDNKADADLFAAQTWGLKVNAERIADPNAHSVVDAVRLAFKAKPWLWAVMAVSLVVIILLCVYCCCWPWSPVPTSEAVYASKDVGHNKKSDAVSPDDEAAATVADKTSLETSDTEEETMDNDANPPQKESPTKQRSSTADNNVKPASGDDGVSVESQTRHRASSFTNKSEQD